MSISSVLIGFVIVVFPLLGCVWLVKRLFPSKPDPMAGQGCPGCQGQVGVNGKIMTAEARARALYWN